MVILVLNNIYGSTLFMKCWQLTEAWNVLMQNFHQIV